MTPAKPLVLIVEDDPASAEALRFILIDWGAEVIHAAQESALPALAPRLADIAYIITDFHLGDGADGVTLVQTLAQFAPQARVLVLSGSFHGRAQEAAIQAGLEVMQKPARANSIIEWLERA
jgi:CheY-like chemotaxis protein